MHLFASRRASNHVNHPEHVLLYSQSIRARVRASVAFLSPSRVLHCCTRSDVTNLLRRERNKILFSKESNCINKPVKNLAGETGKPWTRRISSTVVGRILNLLELFLATFFRVGDLKRRSQGAGTNAETNDFFYQRA